MSLPDTAGLAGASGEAAASGLAAGLAAQGGVGTGAVPAVAGSGAARPAPQAAPATQIAGVAASLHLGSVAAPSVTLHLEPVALGSVLVRLDRGHDGALAVSITVARPETLHLIQMDLPHLHQALDSAGLPSADRSVSLQLDAQAAPAGGSFGGQTDSRGGGEPRGGRPATRSDGLGDSDEPAPPPLPRQWLRAGVNITA